MNIENIKKYWISLAEYDLETAKSMLNTGIYMNLGFMCHQVIEKLLIGYFWHIKQDEPPFDCNLSKLSDELSLSDKLTGEQMDFLDSLELYSRRERYQGEQSGILSSPTKENFQDIIAKTEDIYKWILQSLNI
jgi:HEPN domain-containing protein